MDINTNLDKCKFNEDKTLYYVPGREERSTYNLTGDVRLKAEIKCEKNGEIKVTLQEKKLSDFQEARILLAGVKNDEISFLEIKKESDDREFTVDVSSQIQNLEHNRNKSARILLEVIENGQYCRYILGDEKKARKDKALQKGKKSWICAQFCSEYVTLTDEMNENEKKYALTIYMDKKGAWFLGFCNMLRCFRMTGVCNLHRFSIKGNFLHLNLEIEIMEEHCHLQEIVFRFRSKLAEERVEYRFEIKKNKMKAGTGYVEAVLDLNRVELKSLYWDVLVRFEQEETGMIYDTAVAMTRRCRLYTAFLYLGKYRDGNGFFLYPYNTVARKLAFQFREEGEYDGLSFRLKEMTALVLYKLFKPYWDKRHIQLVYEKFCMMAQDNGFYFFKYCMENHEEERQKSHIYYVITKDAADRQKLLSYKEHLIDFMSIRHMIYMQASKLLVSTDTRSHLYAIRQRGSILKRYLRKKPIVFLQHGVTALKRVDFFYGKGKAGSCNLFVVTSDFEKKIVEDHFGYTEDEIVNSGFARWDVLEDKSEGVRELLIMPTWRTWLENVTPEEFKKSDYFSNYMELLNSDRFRDFLEKNDLHANFYLHSKFREFMQDFSVESPRIRLIAFGEEPANELIMRCKMLVTDYSSVCWDVFYLDKPVVFFQFDRDKYEEAHGSYLDMSKELFGDCTDNVSTLLDYLEECQEDAFQIKPQYEKMRRNFYKYYDDQNSRRICDAIVEKWPGEEC